MASLTSGAGKTSGRTQSHLVNWLSHLHLAAPTSHARVGGLLPDLLSKSTLDALPPEFQPSIREHHLIDAFTDSHPVFRRSRARLSPAIRRYSGVLIDLFYDHFLTLHWHRLGSQPLGELLSSFDSDVESICESLPAEAFRELTGILQGAWLGSYGDPEGLRRALERIGHRFRRPTDLTPALDDLTSCHAELEADFLEFYPQLQAHVENHRAASPHTA